MEKPLDRWLPVSFPAYCARTQSFVHLESSDSAPRRTFGRLSCHRITHTFTLNRRYAAPAHRVFVPIFARHRLRVQHHRAEAQSLQRRLALRLRPEALRPVRRSFRRLNTGQLPLASLAGAHLSRLEDGKAEAGCDKRRRREGYNSQRGRRGQAGD